MEWIDQITQDIQQNAERAPYIIFGLLLLAGFNLPVSEDLMLFISGSLAQANPDLLWPLFIGVYMGAFFSDVICYWMGRLLGPKLWKIKFFAKMVSTERVEQLSGFYTRYGMMTLIVGRFIPFGVRNGLFLTAGLGKMPFLKFAFSDLVAASISCGVYFWLYFTYADAVIDQVKQANIIIFSLAAVGVVYWLVKNRLAKRRAERESK